MNRSNVKKFGCLVFAGMLAFGMFGCSSSQTVDSSANAETAEKAKNVDSKKDEIDTSDATTGEKNALKSALSYLKYAGFSREGLITQLEFEQFSTEEATYAADKCGADWNEQAVKCAKNYLNTSAFSHDGLIHQLEFEKFTTEQATYGADKCGADWNEQAAKCAKSYLELGSYSRESLINQLEFEKFTPEQAEYGVTQNGY